MPHKKVQIQLLSEPGAQVMCRVLGMVALFNAEIAGGVIRIKPQGMMSIQLKLILANPEKAALLLTRLRNLVEIRRARMATMDRVREL